MEYGRVWFIKFETLHTLFVQTMQMMACAASSAVMNAINHIFILCLSDFLVNITAY